MVLDMILERFYIGFSNNRLKDPLSSYVLYFISLLTPSWLCCLDFIRDKPISGVTRVNLH